MSKKKIIIIIVSALVLFILLVAALFLRSYSENKKVNNAKNPVIVQQNNKPVVSSTTPSSAVQVTNLKDKNEIKDLMAKELKKENTAAPKFTDVYKSIDACAAIKTEADKNICITLWAENKKDPNLCSQASTAGQQDCQDRAYLAKAVAEKKISLCASIKSSDMQGACVSKVILVAGLTENDCLPLVGKMAKQCLTDVIMAKVKTISDCNSIYDANIKKICQNYFYGQ